MADMTPFEYSGFWDVPRYLSFTYRETKFLLQSPFDETLDEYPSAYSVYIASGSDNGPGSLYSLESLLDTPLALIGQIQIGKVLFDPSKRRELDASCLDGLLSARGRGTD